MVSLGTVSAKLKSLSFSRQRKVSRMNLKERKDQMENRFVLEKELGEDWEDRTRAEWRVLEILLIRVWL